MAERIGWDKYEVALLIEACEKVDIDKISRLDAVKEVSTNLRKRALKQGKVIDDIFRNENGIGMQFSIMSALLKGVDSGLHKASKLFSEMVLLRKTNPNEFDKILCDAKLQIADERTAPKSMGNNKDEFYTWLQKQDNIKLSPDKIIAVIDECSEYAMNHGITKKTFWDIVDKKVYISISSRLLSQHIFRLTHRNTAKDMDKCQSYYRDFLKEMSQIYDGEMNISSKIKAGESEQIETKVNDEIPFTSENANSELSTQIESLLKISFQYGVRLSSVRDIMRFRLAAEEAKVELPENDEDLKTIILSCGVMIDDKIFAKNDNMEEDLKEKIEAIFSSGNVIIYYESLFYAEQDWMEQHHISSDAILKDILKSNLTEYNYTRVFFTKEKKKTEFDALSEELKRVWGENAIAEISQLSKSLLFVPYENIQRVLFATNHFVWVSEGHYLLVDRIIISEDEKEAIMNYVEKSCGEKGYASLTDIPMGSIAENNSFVSGNPLYSAVYNIVLREKYRNNGKILTTGDTTINIVSLLSREFCDRGKITFDEVNNRVTELNGGSKRQDTFEILYGNFIRISEDEFVATQNLHFDIEEIDRILSDIFPDGFGAIKDVTTFAMFPVCGTLWNHYVLESFCYKFSHKYYLCVRNFNSKNAGIIVEKQSDYTYEQMLAITLAKEPVELTETAAGEYLFQRGMMAKRKYAKLDEIIKMAEEIRKEK